eukprot:CAMPEP_0184383790 /NCGR_PEP_ID=MMETSP0007-20130409/7419_1 /TAXON_ID=97485 /ORGANISM="Prymnesium parvum, Strain Texoma1" /LENGTH=51 /DNA_ID=CAMNT_0026730421 /DNA_START=36 /DNA_END=191 /DNA_ORIENTATION=+
MSSTDLVRPHARLERMLREKLTCEDDAGHPLAMVARLALSSSLAACIDRGE